MTVATGGEGATGPLPTGGPSVAPVPTYPPAATVLTDRFTRAVDYAREVHAGDTRKGTAIPYLSHLLAVAALVLEHGGSEDQAIAALLHDAAEDHGGHAHWPASVPPSATTWRRWSRPARTASSYEAATKEDWWSRKVGYLSRFAARIRRWPWCRAPTSSTTPAPCSATTASLGEKLWARFNADAGRAGTLWYYQRLAEVIAERLEPSGDGPAALAHELSRTVDRLVEAVSAEVGDEQIAADIAASRRKEADVMRRLRPS